MSAASKRHSQLKEKWLHRLKAGVGTLVVAAAVVSGSKARAATPPAEVTLEERVQQARQAFGAVAPDADRKNDPPERVAWWANRWGVARPMWPNWPNWHNWHNWPNWPNY